MAVKAKRLVMDGQDVLEDTSAADAVQAKARRRAVADEQFAADRARILVTLDRIGKGLAGWTASREAGRPWEWTPFMERPVEEWRGLQKLALLFAQLQALRDRVGYLESFYEPLWCAACNPGQEFPGNPWTKWDCVDHSYLAPHALNIGRDLFGGFQPTREER